MDGLKMDPTFSSNRYTLPSLGRGITPSSALLLKYRNASRLQKPLEELKILV